MYVVTGIINQTFAEPVRETGQIPERSVSRKNGNGNKSGTAAGGFMRSVMP